MKGSGQAPAGQLTSGATMSEGDHTLRLHKAEGVRIGAVVVFMVVPLAVVAVLVCWAVPDSVGRMELFAEVTVVREGEGSIGVAGRRVVIVILWRGEPPEVMLTSIFYSGGQGDTPSAHSFRSIMIQNEGAMIKVRVDA